MSLFLAICQGVGLSIAVGTFAGASGRRDAIGVALAIVAAIAGAVLFAISMSNRDHPAIVGVPLGAILAVVSFQLRLDVSPTLPHWPGGREAPWPVTLAEVKADRRFADFQLTYMPRLSVMPVSDAQWKMILKMGGEKD